MATEPTKTNVPVSEKGAPINTGAPDSRPGTKSFRPDESKIPPVGLTKPDAYEQMIMEGKVSNHDGTPVQAVQGQKAHVLGTDEQMAAKGELDTGDAGWIELDEKGSPVGSATKRPPLDKPAAPVATIVPSAPLVLATPAGAFLTDINMQPSPHMHKYHTSSYNRDYAAIAEERGELKYTKKSA